MKYIITLLILNLTFCLQVKKSPFDMNTGGGLMFGFLFALASISPEKNINDINGDGFADLVVAAPSYASSGVVYGRVYIFNGTATGITLKKFYPLYQLPKNNSILKTGLYSWQLGATRKK